MGQQIGSNGMMEMVMAAERGDETVIAAVPETVG